MILNCSDSLLHQLILMLDGHLLLNQMKYQIGTVKVEMCAALNSC